MRRDPPRRTTKGQPVTKPRLNIDAPLIGIVIAYFLAQRIAGYVPDLNPDGAQAAIEALRWLITSTGSGYAAYTAIQLIRQHWPEPTEQPASQAASVVYALFYAPRYARYTAIVMAAVISVGAQIVLAAIEGRPLMLELDQAISAIVAAQVIHGYTLTTTTPAQLAAMAAPIMPIRIAERRRVLITPHQSVEPITTGTPARPIFEIPAHQPGRADIPTIGTYPGTMPRPNVGADDEPTVEQPDDRT